VRRTYRRRRKQLRRAVLPPWARFDRSRRKAQRKLVHGPPARYRLLRSSAAAPLREFTRAQPPEALHPDYEDLWFLYRAVRERRPENVLEFGSGCSTAVIAAALAENGKGHLWSVEGDEMWADATRRALPRSLEPVVSLLHSPVREDDRDVAGWSYATLPDVDPDFVYLDGPVLTNERPIAFDPLDLEHRFRPGFVMVVDGRRINSRYLRDRFTRRYRFTEMPWRYVFELVE
jgi:hypothetical protein